MTESGITPLGAILLMPMAAKINGKKISCQTAGITEKTLNGVSQSFLFFIHHIAHHHLEGLHGHIDRGIKEHQ